MTNQQDAMEAAARALSARIYEEGEVYWALESGTDIPALVQDRIAQAAVQAYLAAREAEGFTLTRPIRIERVKGNSVDEFRANLSRDLYLTGDCVLAWVNEGDLGTAEFNRMLAARPTNGDS